MPPEDIPHKNILNIALKVVVIIVGTTLLVLGVSYIYWYYYIQNTITEPITQLQPKEPTEEEKLLKQQIDSLDKLRQQVTVQNTSLATTTIQSQIKSIDTLRSQSNKQKASATVVKKTMEQQIQSIDTLRVQAK